MVMLNNLINLITSIQLIRQLIGGTWYCIADYDCNKAMWLHVKRDVPNGYYILDIEEWS
jgi:hypothetical protein